MSEQPKKPAKPVDKGPFEDVLRPPFHELADVGAMKALAAGTANEDRLPVRGRSDAERRAPYGGTVLDRGDGLGVDHPDVTIAA